MEDTVFTEPVCHVSLSVADFYGFASDPRNGSTPTRNGSISNITAKIAVTATTLVNLTVTFQLGETVSEVVSTPIFASKNSFRAFQHFEIYKMYNLLHRFKSQQFIKFSSKCFDDFLAQISQNWDFSSTPALLDFDVVFVFDEIFIGISRKFEKFHVN